jgi:integrase
MFKTANQLFLFLYSEVRNCFIHHYGNTPYSWAGSLVRIGRRPPKPVVASSNLAPPAFTCTQHLFSTYCQQYVRAVTVKGIIKKLRTLNRIGDLENPEQIKTLICTSQVSESMKQLSSDAYDHYAKFRGISWVKPHFHREEKPFFLPLESELDMLIANTRLKMSVFLQFLKETGVDSGEAWKLRWLDIDVLRKTVSVTPTKNHSARVLPVSENLLSRLQRLPKKNERVFSSVHLDKMRWLYERARNLLSIKLGNPRLHEIAFKSFRHWKATMLYYQTKDILYVKWFLGHKRLENTLVYTHLVNFEGSDFACKVAKSIKECTSLIEQGFEYVTEFDAVKLFRKRK